jgi:capsular exopolysaccharide synthesis family protein
MTERIMNDRSLSGNEGMNVHDYLDTLFRRKWLLLGIFTGIIAMTVLITKRMHPLYEASATLMVETGNKSDILSAGQGNTLLNFGAPRIANHVELLKSRSLALKVAGRLPDSTLRRLVLFANSQQPAPNTGHLTDTAQILQNLVSARPVREADIVQVRVTAPAPDLARDLANLYAQTYQDYSLEQARTDVSAIRQFIEDQLMTVGHRLDSSERALEDFKRANRFVDLDAETKALISRQSELTAMHQQVATEVQGADAQLFFIKNRIERENQGMTAKLGDISSPLVANLKATLDQLEVEKANLLIQGYPEASARVTGLTRQTADIRDQLNRESQRLVNNQGFIDPVGQLRDLCQSALTLENSQSSLKAREEILNSALSGYDVSLGRLPRAERLLARQTRDVETDRRVYSLMSERYEEARIQEVGRIPAVRTIDTARFARKIRPNVPSNLLLGFLFAVALAFGTAFAVDYLDTSVHTAQELERQGFSLLASIPQLGSRRERQRNGTVTRLMTHMDPESPGAEAFRMLRTSIAFASLDRRARTIAVTSAVPSEGKSTVAVNLATVLSQAGHRTLLIDADLRRPVLHTVFHHRKRPGFSDIVLTGLPAEKAVFSVGVERLDCLPSGMIPPSPADVLNSSATDRLLTSLGKDYEFIVIDTPPVLVAADTPIIASKADATVLVVRAGATSSDALVHARQVLGNAGAKLLGTVLNGVKHTGRYGNRYYYYYKYRYARPETADRRRDSQPSTPDTRYPAPNTQQPTPGTQF